MRNEQWGIPNKQRQISDFKWVMTNEQWAISNGKWAMRNEQWYLLRFLLRGIAPTSVKLCATVLVLCGIAWKLQGPHLRASASKIHLRWKPRVSNASGFFLRAIASPVNSLQFRAIPHNCAQFENTCAQFRKVARNSAPLRATEFRLEILRKS